MKRALTALAWAMGLGLAVAASAHRLPQPVSVQADSIQMNEHTGVSHYRGHVRLVQDGLTIHAERVRVLSAHGKVIRIEAHGDPLHLEDDKTGALPIFGQGRILHFRARRDEVTLIGGVVFRQGRNVLHAHIVHYYIGPQRITAIRGPHARIHARILVHHAHTQGGS